ncbi:MAG TPA: efflux RND transporter periplasmic adaptor subunit [Longimicrobium sp.]|nr:efflux RND transporter periplasmic adaptor subunit [Longimicrobium sp.]
MSTTVQLPARRLASPPSANGRAGRAPNRLRRRRTVRRAAYAAAALAAVALVLWTLRPVPLAVETAAAARGPLRVTVDEDGVTRLRDRYVIAAPVAGRLLRVELEAGDAVEPGQVVARIAAPPLDARTAEQGRARVAAAQAGEREAGAAVARLRAELAQARRDLRRLRALEQAGAVSAQRAEQAATDVEARARLVSGAEAHARAAAAEVRAARAALSDADPARLAAATVTPVRSPVRGRVLRVAQESETAVAPGTPLVELGDAAALEIQVDVLSADAVRIRPGMPMWIEEWGGGGALEARVRTVSPAAFTKVSALGVEEQRVNVTGDLPRAPAGLGEGYRVEARVVTWEAADVLKVPTSAVFRHGGGWAVFVVDAGRARLRPLTLGHRGEAEAEVQRGLRAGEVVVLYPSDEVAEGVRVVAQP